MILLIVCRPDAPMKTFVRVFVEGTPKPQAQVITSTRYGGKRRIVRTKAVRDWMEAIREKLAAINISRMEGPLHVKLSFFLCKPKYLPKKPTPKHPYVDWPVGRKHDLDNLAKVVLDACTGILWNDDGQIVELELSKGWALDNPEGVEIEVTELE